MVRTTLSVPLSTRRSEREEEDDRDDDDPAGRTRAAARLLPHEPQVAAVVKVYISRMHMRVFVYEAERSIFT